MKENEKKKKERKEKKKKKEKERKENKEKKENEKKKKSKFLLARLRYGFSQNRANSSKSLQNLERYLNKVETKQIKSKYQKYCCSYGFSRNSSTSLSEKENQASKCSFIVGDNVEICKDGIEKLKGRVISVIDQGSIVVMPKHEQLKEPLEFHPSELEKQFKCGDYVQVRYNIIRNLQYCL